MSVEHRISVGKPPADGTYIDALLANVDAQLAEEFDIDAEIMRDMP